MGCFYKIDGTPLTPSEKATFQKGETDPNKVIEGDTFDIVRQKILQKLGYRNDLNFKHASLTERVNAAVGKLQDNYTHANGLSTNVHSVTDQLNKLLDTYLEKKDMDPVQKFINYFQIGTARNNATPGRKTEGLGHIVHQFMSASTSELEEEEIRTALDFMEKAKRRYDALTQEEKSKFSNRRQSNLPSFIANALENRQTFGQSLIDAKQKIDTYFAGYEKLTEIDVAARPGQNHTWLKGRIDALYYSEAENKIIIVDYKTQTGSGISYSAVDIRNYLQLALYRRMLESMGLHNDVKIEIKNVFLEYQHNGTVTFNTTNVRNMDSMLNLENIKQADANLEHVFPFPPAFEELSNSDVQQSILTVQSQYDKLFDIPYLQRLKPKHFKEELQKQFNRGQSIFCHSASKMAHIVNTGENKWTLYTLNNKGIKTEWYIDQTAEEICEMEMQKAIANLSKYTHRLGNIITSGNVKSLQNFIGYDRAKSEKLYSNLSKYFGNLWTRYKYPQLEAMGILCFKNQQDHSLEFIILNDFQAGFETFIDHTGSLISGIDNTESFTGIPQKTFGNALKLKGLLAIAPIIKAISEAIDTKVKIGNINVLSLQTGEKDIQDITPFIQCLEELQKKDSAFSGVYDCFSKHAVFTPKIELYKKELSQAIFAKSHSSVLNGIFDNFDNVNIQEKIKKLRRLQQIIQSNNPKEIPEDPTKIDLTSEVGKIYAMTSRLILKLQGFESGQPERVSRFSVTSADTLASMLNVFKTGQLLDYTDRGEKVTGIFGGMQFATAYNSPSKFVDWGNQRMLAFQHSISKSFIDSIDDSNAAAIEFIEEQTKLGVIKGGQIIDSFVGAHRDAYLRLLKQKNGNHIPECKNPFTDGSLTGVEKKYLTQFLWNINKYRMPNSVFPDKYKALSSEEMMKNQEAHDFFKGKLQGDSSWLHLPLMPSSHVRGFIQSIADYKNGKKTGAQVFQTWKERIQRFGTPNDLSITQMEEQEESMSKLENYNIYRDSEESRAAMLEKHESINNFELNFNYLQNDLQLKYITEQFNTHLLKEVRDLIVVMQMAQMSCNIDLSDQMATVLDRTKIMIYGTNISPSEVKEATGALGTLKSALSLAKIGFRASSMAKEGIVGRLKNWSMTAAKLIVTPTGQKLKYSTLMKASTEVWPEGFMSGRMGFFLGKHKLGQFTKIEALSNRFQITDKDMHTISETMSADRTGFLNSGIRSAYYTAVRLDWYNRNQIFVGCMMEDGCFDAYEFDEKTGKISYNMSKDARFDEFWKHRNDANYSTEKFEYQKALYLVMMEQFNKDNPFNQLHYGETDEQGNTYGYDALPDAYTSKQLMAIKEQIGMLYGMYDHQEKTSFENQTWWQLMTAMLTYLPGEIHKYFMKPGQSSIGAYRQLSNDKGELLYFDENGNITTEKKNSQGKYNKPYVEWSGEPVQGLYYSTLSTVGKLLRGTYHALKGDMSVYKSMTSYEINSSLVFIFNMLWGVGFAFLLRLLWKLIFGKEEPTKEDDAKLQALFQTLDSLGQRSGNDMSFLTSVWDPIMDFGFVGVDFVSESVGDLVNLMGDASPDKIVNIFDNISAIKDLQLGELV